MGHYLSSFYLTAPEIFLSFTGLMLTLYAAFAGQKSGRTATTVAVGALLVAAIFTGILFVHPSFELGGEAFGGVFRHDGFSSFTKVLIYLATIASLVVAPRFFDKTNEYRPEYPVLMIFAAVGMGLMVSAVDLMTLYIGLELSSLSAYVLASFARSDGRSAEAGLKYFVLGALASGILLYGMSLVYGFTGSTDYIGIANAVDVDGGISTGLLFGIVFMLVGMAFKISAVPFHMWTPDVYEGAPTPVTMFFGTAPKVAAVAVLARLALDPFGAEVDSWRQIVIFAALASIVLGAFGAIGQTNIKRLLAYSSINNIGFILIGLAAGTKEGASAMLTYLVFYVAMTLGSFVAVLMLRDKDGNQVEKIADLSGLSRSHMGLALCLAVMMFSLAGIPPMMGFWGKYVVFQAAVDADLLLLAVLGIAASVIGAFYYLKIVKVIYFDDPAGVVTSRGSASEWAILVLTTLIVSPLGFLFTIALNGWTQSAAAALFGAA